MTEPGWIHATITAARPQAVAALMRYFRDLDRAEEAFQEASLRALTAWTRNGPPRDGAAWLIMVGKNAGVDRLRRDRRNEPLPAEDQISDRGDRETEVVERIDAEDYRDDILRLLFICCHPDLANTQQIALALRIVSGLSVTQIARAFLVSESAMEQRITRAKARIAKSGATFEAPGAAERAERLPAVMTMIYLVFNEGYTCHAHEQGARTTLCVEAIRLARLLLRLFPTEPDVMGLTALLLLQHARADARFDENGEAVLLDAQDRRLWNASLIAEGRALVDKAVRHRRPGPYLIHAAIAALHASASTADETDWAEIALLYGVLERLQPSPVVALNRAVAVFKHRGARDALAIIEPLAEPLDGYFYYHGARGAFLAALGDADAARIAFNRAIALANSPAEAANIRRQIEALAATVSADGEGCRGARNFSATMSDHAGTHRS